MVQSSLNCHLLLYELIVSLLHSLHSYLAMKPENEARASSHNEHFAGIPWYKLHTWHLQHVTLAMKFYIILVVPYIVMSSLLTAI